MDAKLASAFARRIPFDAHRIVAPISLLPHLWRSGVLGGRGLTVLMNRSPLAMLHDQLDHAARLHPESTTAADFRAPSDLVALEHAALLRAERFITPHHSVAAYLRQRYAAEVDCPAWIERTPTTPMHGNGILFPASALGRKGAFEVRAAAKALGWPIHVLGRATESTDFWQGVDVRAVQPRQPFDQMGCVVLPAFVEQQPRILLMAQAAGVPVICSPECGLAPDTHGVMMVDAGDVAGLIAVLRHTINAVQQDVVPARRPGQR